MKLFVSGIPSSGKTTFANWLRDEFGFAACKDWMRKTGRPDNEFREQVAAIDSRIAEIRSLFANGWIDVIAPDGSRLSFSEICRRLSIQPRFRKV